MRAALGRALLGMATLWIRHRSNLSNTPTCAATPCKQGAVESSVFLKFCRARRLLCGLYRCGQILKCTPPWIDLRLATATRYFIQVAATAWAQSLAIGLAKRAIGQGQQHLLAHGIFQHQTAVFIVPDFRLGLTDRSLALLRICARRSKDQVKVFFGMVLDRLKAACAQQLKVGCEPPAQTYVVHHILGPAMFFNTFCAALHMQRRTLPHIQRIFQHADWKGLINHQWVGNQVGRDNSHRTAIIAVLE